MNIEKLKQIVRGNAFQESHGSTTLVVDVETVIDLLDDLKQYNIPVVIQRSELLIDFFQSMEAYDIHTTEIGLKEGVDKYLKSINRR